MVSAARIWSAVSLLWIYIPRASGGRPPRILPSSEGLGAILVRLVGHATNTVDLKSWIQLMGHTSADRSISSTDLVGSVPSLDTNVSRGCLVWVSGRPSIRVTRPRLSFLEPQGTVSPSSNPPRRGLGLLSGAWGTFFLRMPGVSWLWPWARTHLKKGFVPHSAVWWGLQLIDIKLIDIRTDLTSFGYTVFWHPLFLASSLINCL